MDTGITIFCWKGSKNRVARTSQSRPSFSLNHSNHCAVGTYWFLKRHFWGWFGVIFLFFLFSVVAFFITFFFDWFQQNNSNHAAVEPSVFWRKNVPPFKKCDFSIFHLRVCCFSLNLTRISCWWNIAPKFPQLNWYKYMFFANSAPFWFLFQPLLACIFIFFTPYFVAPPQTNKPTNPQTD